MERKNQCNTNKKSFTHIKNEQNSPKSTVQHNINKKALQLSKKEETE